MNYTIEFPDGQVISAGSAGSAIRSLRVSRAAFPSQSLEPGGVYAGELEAEFFDEGLSLTAGDLLLLRQDGALVGTFLAQMPTTPTPGVRRVLAYDWVTRLDTDLSDWLAGLTGWPYALSDFAQMVCAACGLTLTGELENGDWPVARFAARGITGRQLMQWVCQAGCRFCRAQPDGTLALCWLNQRALTLGFTGADFYYQGSLTVADYTVQPTDGVCVALTESDVGVLSPQTAQNVLTLRGNYLLCGCGEAQAAAIAAPMAGFSYTPCTLTTPTAIWPGDVFSVETDSGTVQVVAMTVEATPFLYRVECTGTAQRTGSAAICRGDYRAMSGRVLELELGLQGITSRLVQAEQTQTQYSQLSQDVDHITARVGVLETDSEQRFSALALRSDGLEVTVGGLSTALEGKADGTQLAQLQEHFLFDGSGLTVFDSATGMGIHLSQQQVAFSGGTDPTTVITPNAMETTRMQVHTRLDVGGFALIPRTSGNLSLRYTGA